MSVSPFLSRIFSCGPQRRRSRAEPTLTGSVVVALCLALGTAAYNSGSNILFLVLAALLASFLLSGVLSALNFRGAEFELLAPSAAREGEPALVSFLVRNTKRRLPLQSLGFELSARLLTSAEAGDSEQRVSARIELGSALEAGEERHLHWEWTPPRRGRWKIELEAVSSLFPFGFLRKRVRVELTDERLVWPARLPVSSREPLNAQARKTGERQGRRRGGDLLLSLRDYRAGDSHRLVHWKASARHRRLLVRRFAGAADAGRSVLVSTDRDLWRETESFEEGLALAASLAERLFAEERLAALALDDRRFAPLRGRGDFEQWLDLLAEARLGDARRPLPQGLPGAVCVVPDGQKGACIRAEVV